MPGVLASPDLRTGYSRLQKKRTLIEADLKSDALDCHTVLRPSSRPEEKARVASSPRRSRVARGAWTLGRGAGHLARGAEPAARAHVRSRSRPSATATHQPGEEILSIASVCKYPKAFLWALEN